MGRWARGAGRVLVRTAGAGRGRSGFVPVNTRAMLGVNEAVYDYDRYDTGKVYSGGGPARYDVSYYDAGARYADEVPRLAWYDMAGHRYDQGRTYLG